MKTALTSEIKHFLDSKIHSVDELEVLLLIRDKPDKDWDAMDISQEIRIDPITASNLLMGLYLRGLLGHQENHGRFYRFRYREEAKDYVQPLSELATLFQRARSEVIDYIMTSQRQQLRAFSNAFEPKKGK